MESRLTVYRYRLVVDKTHAQVKTEQVKAEQGEKKSYETHEEKFAQGSQV